MPAEPSIISATGRPDGRITPVILSGGAGTRLWPLSVRARPKQMLALTGDQTMLQMTASRVSDPAIFSPPMLVTAASQGDAVRAQLGDVGIAIGRLLLEPAARNTAPAIALAALAAASNDLLLVMPSDHLIADPATFVAAVSAARARAEAGWLVTFGITPDKPETGFGYIRRGVQLEPGLFHAESFVEKPDAATANAYLADGGYDWNAGIFLFSAGAYLKALAQYAPDIDAAVHAAMASARRDAHCVYPDPARFESARSQSIDHAIMEKADNVAVMPVQVGWSDLGSWQSLYDASPKDDKGNVLAGDALTLGSRDCLIRSDGPLVVAVGVENLVIIATGDAVLVIPKEESQRVQEAVEKLRAKDDSRI